MYIAADGSHSSIQVRNIRSTIETQNQTIRENLAVAGFSAVWLKVDAKYLFIKGIIRGYY